CLYYHVGDAYATAESHNRASYYAVGGIPEVDFDAMTEVVGAGTNIYDVYAPIVATRYAESTPVTLTTEGIIYAAGDPDSSWVTTVFKAVDTVPYGDLRAYFVVYENTSEIYPWTVRDMLPVAPVTTLAAPGDSIVITRKFKVDAAWNLSELHVAVFIEDTDPTLIVNAQVMPAPFGNSFDQADRYAVEIDYFGEAVYYITLENTGVMRDSIVVDIGHDIIPDGLGQWDWVAFYCDTGGACHFGPWGYVLEPGETEVFDVHITDTVGHTQGMALTSLTATSTGDPSMMSSESFATFVDLPSILLVDDDGGESHETYLETALSDTGYTAMVWDAEVRGRPCVTRLESYWAVLWTTGGGSAADLGGSCENNMATYLDGGGNLLLASMEFLSSRVNTLAFRTDYLHIDSYTSDNGGFVVTGETGDVISAGMSLSLLGGPFAPNPSDVFVAGSPAQVIFTSPAGTEGIRVSENDHKVVFLSFPFEDVKTTEAAPDNQKTLIGRILSWFRLPAGIEDGEVHRLALHPNYPNPFNPVTRVAFSVPEAAGRVSLTVHNVNGQVVRTLVDSELPAGPALAVWDGTDDLGRPLASGIYFAKLASSEDSAFRKMTLLK
ncbi:hypothetical protein KAW64_04815, partial [bacterium]|nr:hypothetical protein [bacterium]